MAETDTTAVAIIPDGRPAVRTLIPADAPGVADTLVIEAAGPAPRPVSPLVGVPAAVDANPEIVRFRDERALAPWWRLRPNIPVDPAIAEPEHADPARCTVEIRITTPDTATARGAVIVRNVHPEMVGDYIRAGWRRA